MKRNSTILFLESPGGTTALPWANNAPDFSGFTDPTLSVLQQSWADFLASGGELEVIADPEPQPEAPPPRWTEFNIAMLSNQNWQQWKTGIVDDLRIALITSSVVGKSDAFQSAYDLACSLSPPSSAAIEEWRTIGESFSIPINW